MSCYSRISLHIQGLLDVYSIRTSFESIDVHCQIVPRRLWHLIVTGFDLAVTSAQFFISILKVG